MMKMIVGIDEAGRGPLAGPVAVGAVAVPENFNTVENFCEIFGLLKDSKKLSEKRRIEIFNQIKKLSKEKLLRYSVALVSNKTIDDKGIVHAIRKGVEGTLERLSLDPNYTKVFLDGSLKAPEIFRFQETIIKGDEKIPVISLASIVAKVTRDEYMKKVAKEFIGYGFEIHKGYGTAKHLENLKNLGVSSLHRTSFLKDFTN